MTRAPLVLAGAVLALWCASAAAAPQTAEELSSFADHLFDRGDYYRAITEYERLLFFHPGDRLADRARLRIAESYLRGGKYDQALGRLRDLARAGGGSEAGRSAQFLLAETFFRRGEYSRAAEEFDAFADAWPDDPRAAEARIQSAWARLRQGDWAEAAEGFRRIPADSPMRQQADALAGASPGFAGLPRKSPALAGGLSAVLPGAGQLYLGRPTDAATAFLLNAAFIWAAAESFQRDNDAVGGILLFFEAGWYFGNVYNAVSGAHKHNRRSEQRFFEDLRERFGILLSYDRQDGGTALLALRF
jgi:tetratricopeptide (TPR) repeat protein